MQNNRMQLVAFQSARCTKEKKEKEKEKKGKKNENENEKEEGKNSPYSLIAIRQDPSKKVFSAYGLGKSSWKL